MELEAVDKAREVATVAMVEAVEWEGMAGVQAADWVAGLVVGWEEVEAMKEAGKVMVGGLVALKAATRAKAAAVVGWVAAMATD